MKLLLFGGVVVLACMGMFSTWEGMLVPVAIYMLPAGMILSFIGLLLKDKQKVEITSIDFKLLLFGGIVVLASVGMFLIWEGMLTPVAMYMLPVGLILSFIGLCMKNKLKE